MQPESPDEHVPGPIWNSINDDQQLRCAHIQLPDDLGMVTVNGEIDQATAPRLKTELLTAIARTSPRLVIDLSGVTFIDSAGLTVILAARQRARAQGGDTYLLGPTKQVRKVLAITSLDRLFEIHDTLEGVQAAQAPAG